ncbi:MAG: type II secretion system protein [Planctomycetota bacterium]
MPIAEDSQNQQLRQGFALLELLIFIVLLTAASVWGLPMLLEARKSENETHAVEYLRMMASAEQLWKQEIGSYVEVRRLAESVPNPAAGGFHLRPSIFGRR